MAGPALTEPEIDQFLEKIIPPYARPRLTDHRCADFAWQPDPRMRFRVSAYYERERLRVVMRLIKIKLATIDDLELPDTIKTIAGWQRGMVILTGVTGSGKSTTMAAIIHSINEREEPLHLSRSRPHPSWCHENIKSIVSQREVGRDVDGFREGLVQAQRQDPT